MFRRAASRAVGGVAGYLGLATAGNAAYPLHVVWDLDETLISSQRQASQWRDDQKNQILKQTEDTIEHVDDDAHHYISTLRPHARAVLGALSMLPGCRQSVSTAASPGYAANVVRLLESEGKLFERVAADQPSSGKKLGGFCPNDNRAVLVDNRRSCHSTQPRNGIMVEDYVASARELHLSGGARAIGGVFAVRTSSRALAARWPLQPVNLDGTPVGGKPRLARQRTEGALRRTRTDEENARADEQRVRHKLAVAKFPFVDPEAARQTQRRLRDAAVKALAEKAEKRGAAALLVVDESRKTAHRVPPIDFPVLTAGKRCAHTLAGHARNHEEGTAIAAADLRQPGDAELLAVAKRLALCWLVPDVRWVLTEIEPRK